MAVRDPHSQKRSDDHQEAHDGHRDPFKSAWEALRLSIVHFFTLVRRRISTECLLKKNDIFLDAIGPGDEVAGVAAQKARHCLMPTQPCPTIGAASIGPGGNLVPSDRSSNPIARETAFAIFSLRCHQTMLNRPSSSEPILSAGPPFFRRSLPRQESQLLA
jgi:hypothetical protein